MAFLFSRDKEHIKQELKQIIEFNLRDKSTPQGEKILSFKNIKIDDNILYDETNSTRNQITIAKIYALVVINFDVMGDGNLISSKSLEVTNFKQLFLVYNKETDLYDIQMKDNVIGFD